MMRANLLPRPKETLGAFGFEFDVEYLRQAILGVTIALVVALLGFGIEEFRVARLQHTAERLEGAIASQTFARMESKRLALDVARYQEFARQAQRARRSGPQAAIAIARIGNDVPQRVWLDSLTHAEDGYDLGGGASTLDVVSRTILSLGRSPAAHTASLRSIENHSGDGIRFDAHVGTSER